MANKLPQDILDVIVTFLQHPEIDRPALATVSRQWQAAIEPWTFRNIHLKSTDLERFRQAIQSDRRRYMRTLDYFVILPAYSDDLRCRFEREHDRQTNSNAFTAAIHNLFRILQAWDSSQDGYIKLCLRDVFSASDHLFLRRSSPLCEIPKMFHVRRDESNAIVVDLLNWRYRYSYLQLHQPQELPQVNVINIFVMAPTARNIHDRVSIDIAARLPCLHSVVWRMNDWEIRYLDLIRQHRRDLAQTVAEVLPQVSGLQSLTLQMSSMFYWAPEFSTGSLDPWNTTSDTLSEAIRKATSHMHKLQELSVSGTVDESLLWPPPARGLPGPFWQNLERLRIHFSARRPTGASYFTHSGAMIRPPPETGGPPGYGHTEGEDAEAAVYFQPGEHLAGGKLDDELRPDDDSIVPLIEAFGRACLQIPVLKSAELSTHIPTPKRLSTNRSWHGRVVWGVWYLSPGTSIRGHHGFMHPALFEGTRERRLLWDVQDWGPGEHLRELLGTIGRDRYGMRLVERFLDANISGRDLHV